MRPTTHPTSDHPRAAACRCVLQPNIRAMVWGLGTFGSGKCTMVVGLRGLEAIVADWYLVLGALGGSAQPT
eukprot:4624042-Prymnesium_polylepis.1